MCELCVCVASAGGGPVAHGGGVRPGSDAEETGVPQQRGPEAACPADGSGRPAVQRTLPGPGEEGQSLGVQQQFMRYCHILLKHSWEINETSHQNVISVLTLWYYTDYSWIWHAYQLAPG